MLAQKKPVVVEVLLWTGSNLNEVKSFVGEALKYRILDSAKRVVKSNSAILMSIETLEGDMIVTEGDYIIKGVEGEFYPCKPEIFHKTYTILEESSK